MSAWSNTLDALMRERAAALFGYAYVLTGDKHEAEDLLQESLVRTFRTNRRITTVDAAHAYVKRAIATAFIDKHRRMSARPARARSDDGEYGLARASALVPDPTESVATHLDLHAAIRTLPPRERAGEELRYLGALPVAGIASELGLAVGTVKRYLFNGVARLREIHVDVDFETPESIPVISPSQGGRP